MMGVYLKVVIKKKKLTIRRVRALLLQIMKLLSKIYFVLCIKYIKCAQLCKKQFVNETPN